MELRGNSKLENRFFLLLIVCVFATVLILFSSSTARGEAASDLLGRYTCSQAKKLIETDPVTIFNMWLNSGGYFGKSKYAQAVRDQIPYWGTYNDIIENTDLINVLIEGLDEATSGTAENTLKIFAKFFIKKTMGNIAKGTAAGGVLGAVITIGEELYQFASDLNAEILDINVRNIAAAVVGVHPNTGKDTGNPKPELLNEKYFLESYLGWDGEQFIKYNGYSKIREMNARRSMLVDYAGIKLGWDVVGKENTLGGWKLNEIRTAIHILLKDVNKLVEKKRKLKQLQGNLKNQLNELKGEQRVLSTLQSLSQQVLAMTCQKTSQPCVEAISDAQSKIEDYILAADGSEGVSPDSLMSFKDRVNDFYGMLGRLDTTMQTDYKPLLEKYCGTVINVSSLLVDGIAQAQAINIEITGRASQSYAYMETACSATSATLSKESVDLAESMSDEAQVLLASHPTLSSYEQPGQPPAEVDLSGREGELASLEQQAETYRLAIDKSLERWSSVIKSADIAKRSLSYMVNKCSTSDASRAAALITANQMEEKIKSIDGLLPDPHYQDMFLDGLSSKLESARWYLASLQGQNTSYRECIGSLPDLQELTIELSNILEKGGAGVDDASGYATAALTCYNTWEEVSECKVNDDCDEGFLCEDGQCVELQIIQCLLDADCPVGYLCSDSSICIPQDDDIEGEIDEESIFSVAGTEEVDDEEPVFSVAGAEETSNVVVAPIPTIDCSHIPGSIAVQGDCICTDGALLSPSSGRCISCDEYHQAANSAVADGNYSAAQAIVSEAWECSSWTSQIQQLINDAAANQVCEAIAANFRAACQNGNASAVSGFMAEANQSNCNIDDNLWQWGSSLITQYNQRIDDQIVAEERNAQAEAQAQPQNQTNWMDVMSTVIKGVQDIQSGHDRRSSQHSSSGGRHSLPTSIPLPTGDMPTIPGMGGMVYPGAGPWSGSGNGGQPAGNIKGNTRSGSGTGSGTANTQSSNNMSISGCELKFCPVCAKGSKGVDLLGLAINPQCNDCRKKYRGKISDCAKGISSPGNTGNSISKFNTYSVLECKKPYKDGNGRTFYLKFYEVTGPSRPGKPPSDYRCSPIFKGSWNACIDKGRDLNERGNTHYNISTGGDSNAH